MPASQNDRPNLLVIMSDQHNVRMMGCAGDRFVRTPHLDALAAGGVVFSSAYCPYPLCVPSRVGFMTGQYPGDVDVWDNSSALSPDVPTFAHALGGAGYEAVLCGRMHFQGEDQFHGFERRLYGDCGAFLAKDIWGQGDNRTNGQTRYAVEVSGHGRAGFEAFDRIVTDKAAEFLQSRSGDRPWCLVVGYILPHNPLICSKELFDYYMDVLPEPAPPEEWLANLHPAARKWRERRGADQLTPEQNKRGLAAYCGLITTLDANVGKLVEAAREAEGGERTAILYCSDHGDQAWEHGMWWKSNFYEGSARVPLIASWPGRFAAGVEIRSVVNLIDVAPTLLDLAGAEPLPDISGRSLAPFLCEGKPPAGWPDETFGEFIGAHGDQPSAMLRSGPWKLIYYSEFNSCQLFNLEEDPGEMHDRTGEPACRVVRDALLARLKGRWSAERMLEGAAKKSRALRVVRSCGHPMMPHPVPTAEVPPDANEFDFAQVPGWDAIRRRAEAGEK